MNEDHNRNQDKNNNNGEEDSNIAIENRADKIKLLRLSNIPQNKPIANNIDIELDIAKLVNF